MKTIKVYTTSYCTYCDAAKRLLRGLGVPYEDVSLDGEDALRAKLSGENRGWRTVPMIFIGDDFIGGFQELKALSDKDQLLPQVGMKPKH